MITANCQTFFAKHLRDRIAKAGIAARVKCLRPSVDGGYGIRVFTTGPYVLFDDAAQRTIRQIAVDNGMALVCGLPIVVDQMTDPHGMSFYLTDAMIARWRDGMDREVSRRFSLSNRAA